MKIKILCEKCETKFNKLKLKLTFHLEKISDLPLKMKMNYFLKLLIEITKQ